MAAGKRHRTADKLNSPIAIMRLAGPRLDRADLTLRESVLQCGTGAGVGVQNGFAAELKLVACRLGFGRHYEHEASH